MNKFFINIWLGCKAFIGFIKDLPGASGNAMRN